jgi:hypothetical protein
MSGSDEPEEWPKDLSAWLSAGYGRRAAMGWRRWNFAVEKAKEWQRAGVDDALLAAQWQTAGVNPETVDAWQAANIDASAAIRWHEFGFTLDQAAEHTKQGRTAEQAYLGPSRSVSRSAGHARGSMGAQVQAFTEAGVSHQVLGGYLHSKWLDDEALVWAKAGIQAADARVWQLIGLTAAEAGALQKKELQPLEVLRDWWQAGIPFEEVGDWLGAGLTPEEARTQRANGITVEQAAALRALRSNDS